MEVVRIVSSFFLSGSLHRGPQQSNNYLFQYPMRTNRGSSSTLHLIFGIVLAEAGVALVGCGEWDSLKRGTSLLFYASGFLLFAVGMFLIWKEPLSAIIIEDEAMPIPTTGRFKLLGRIDLNGIYFEAYEEETNHLGKRFRLQSSPPIGPEREAAFIRYLVQEGFVEDTCPA
jgi:hypothetical protein